VKAGACPAENKKSGRLACRAARSAVVPDGRFDCRGPTRSLDLTVTGNVGGIGEQNLKVGDRVPMAKNVNDPTTFRVAGTEPNQWMLWQKPNGTWSWKLVPRDGGPTRLITRLKALYAGAPRLATRS
jgi:hypothetical protein